MSTVVNGRDVSAVVAVRLAKLPQPAKERFDVLGAYVRTTHAARDRYLKDMQDLRDQRLELETQDASIARDERSGGETYDSRAARKALRIQIDKLKADRLKIQNQKLPGKADVQEVAERWLGRHGEKMAVDMPLLKTVGERTTGEMFALACQGLAELQSAHAKIDEAALPKADGIARIKRDLDRLEKKGRVNIRGAFKMVRSASGLRSQGNVAFPHVRIEGHDGQEVIDAAAMVYLFRPEVEKRLLAEVAKMDFGGALSVAERAARRAELREQIDNAERICAGWWHRCRAENIDVEPPDVSTPALLGIRPADVDDAPAEEPEADADMIADSDSEFEEADFG